MIKNILIIISFHTLMYAGFMDSVADVVKSTLGDDTEEVSTLKTSGLTEESESLLSKTLNVVQEVTGLTEEKESNALFDNEIFNDVASLIDLEKGESLGFPSVFGFNKKKEKKVFGSTLLGDTVLSDAKDLSTNIYKGFKYSGESTEFMSGVMYRSSKVYNGMFEVFDDSPLNIFEDEEEKEVSLFDLFDQGNTILDIFD